MAEDPGSPIFQGLLDRGFSPVHAAVITGNMQQESNFRPDAVNEREGAHGLLQWRLDRWNALQDFAKSRGAAPTDRDVQLDFIKSEMDGSERKAGSRFMAATDLPGANSALKGFIRYGDNSEPTRLANAARFAGGADQPQAPRPPAAPPAMSLEGGRPPESPQLAGAIGQLPSAPQAPQPQMGAPQPMQQQAPFSLAPQVAEAAPEQDAPMQRLGTPLTAAAKSRLFAALSGRGFS